MSNFAKNDQVIVIAGDDRGKTGRVLKVLREESRLIVEKVNFVSGTQSREDSGSRAGSSRRKPRSTFRTSCISARSARPACGSP